jgi:hypothetical protein
MSGRDTNISDCIMTVLHTPLLGPLCTENTKTDRHISDMKSGAGIYIDRYGGDIRSQTYNTDMRIVQQSHGSPKFKVQINLDKTPTVVGGRIEHFGSISDMICHWEGMEERETENDGEAAEGGGRKRVSKRISELSGRFEEGGGGGSISQSGGGDGIDLFVERGSEGEGVHLPHLETTSSSNSKYSKLQEVVRCNTRENSANIKMDTNQLSSFSRKTSNISSYNNLSTNKNSRQHVSNFSNVWTNQRLECRKVKRKRKAEDSGDQDGFKHLKLSL